MDEVFDEKTPLLTYPTKSTRQTNSSKQRKCLPWRRISVLFLLQISEPITSQVTAPFLPQLIKDIGVTCGKDARVGYYVGITHSLFYLTEACSILHWGRLSDKIGRKPVLLIGFFGLSLSMLGFGLSRTFWGLVVSRCFNGALNGNIALTKNALFEISDPTNVAQAFFILPITWALGMTIGPLIGGCLARPAEGFMKLGASRFLTEYPYLFPCSVPATISAISGFIILLFSTEIKNCRLTIKRYPLAGTTKDRKTTLDPPVCGVSDPTLEMIDGQSPFCVLLTRRALIVIGSYSMLSIVDISFRTVMPVFYAMSIENSGLGLDPPEIGIALAFWGMSSSILQYILFVPVHDWLGTKAMFFITVSLYLPAVSMFPAINVIARTYGLNSFVRFLVGFQILLLTFGGFAFGIVFVYKTSVLPNRASVGATNRIAQIIACIVRAIGPAAIGSAFSLGIEKNVMGGNLAYLIMVGIVALTLCIGSLLPKTLGPVL